MSDHLCEMNDKLLKQNDEIEDLKRSSKVYIVQFTVSGETWTSSIELINFYPRFIANCFDPLIKNL